MAEQEFTLSANSGCAAAQDALALMYLEGLGIKEDDDKAFYWYQQAANQGDSEGEYGLFNLLSGGFSIKRDVKTATQWLKKSADQGYALAEEEMGKLYDTGLLGFKHDKNEARKWYTKAVQDGAQGAQGLLDALD